MLTFDPSRLDWKAHKLGCKAPSGPNPRMIPAEFEAKAGGIVTAKQYSQRVGKLCLRDEDAWQKWWEGMDKEFAYGVIIDGWKMCGTRQYVNMSNAQE